MRSVWTDQINFLKANTRSPLALIATLALALLLSACETSDTATNANPDGTPQGTTDSVVTQLIFDTPTEQNLVFSGVPGPEQSNVTVTASGANGLPVPNAEITFSISGAGVGASLIGQDINGEVSRTTSATGTALVTVQSGTASGIIQVEAVNPATGVSETSANIEISTGVPVDSRLSISLSTFSPENACCADGVTVDVNIRATDQLGTAVPDGTVFQFLASESGLLGDNFCSTTNGACTVVWESSGAEPADGTVTVIAYTNGAEDFTDNNSNGVFDSPGDTFNIANDVSEPYQDYNDNGSYDLGEPFVDLNPANGVWDANDNDTWDQNTVVWESEMFIISEPFRGPGTELIVDCDATTLAVDAPGGSGANGFGGTCAPVISTDADLVATVADVNGNSLEEGAAIEWLLDVNSGGANWELDGINGLTYTVTNVEKGPNVSTVVSFDSNGDEAGAGTISLLVESPGRGKVPAATWDISIP